MGIATSIILPAPQSSYKSHPRLKFHEVSYNKGKRVRRSKETKIPLGFKENSSLFRVFGGFKWFWEKMDNLLPRKCGRLGAERQGARSHFKTTRCTLSRIDWPETHFGSPLNIFEVDKHHFRGVSRLRHLQRRIARRRPSSDETGRH